MLSFLPPFVIYKEFNLLSLDDLFNDLFILNININMTLIDHGSYGKIFLQQDNTIVKELSLFNRDNIIGSATLRELNMHGLLYEYDCGCDC
jgi:hypothetical protein